jgi:diketogulonate reductase-like aldo/keto reductase
VPLKETVGALCKMKRDGLARHVGVSNFDPKLIAEAVKFSTEPLINNQIECHVYFDQSATIAASRKHGLSVTAYSPVARGRVSSDAVLSRIGNAHGKTPAQVCLRYLVQQDIVVIPKTSHSERLKENAAIFDFTLSAAEMKAIAALASPHGNIVS